MRRWTRTVSVLTAMLVAGGASAQDAAPAKPPVDPYIRMAAVKAELEVALRDRASVFDSGKSGFDDNEEAIEKAKDGISDLIERAGKMGNLDENVMETLEKKEAELERRWDEASHDFDSTLSPRYEELSDAFDSLREVFEGLSDAEQGWKRSGADVAPLEQAYAALAKRLSVITPEAEKLVATLKEHRTSWEAERESVQALVSKGK